MSETRVRLAARREILRFGAAGSAALLLGRWPVLAATPECPETEDAGGGPNYKPGAPERGAFVEKGMSGKRLTLTGRVLDTNCQPVRDAVLDLWQANHNGRYDLEGFTLRGRLKTDKSGQYRLQTIVPGEYGPRPHIHVKLNGPRGPIVTTLINIVPDASKRDPKLKRALDALLADAPGGEKAAQFDFVLKLA